MIKLDPATNTFVVSYSRRNPETRQPVTLRRKNIKSKAEAQRVYADLVVKVSEAIKRKIVPTWATLTMLWAEDARARGLTEKTIENYLYNLRAHTFLAWEHRLIDSITTQEIRDIILNDLAKKSDHHKQGCLKFIRCVFQFGVESGHLNRNPCPTFKFRLGDKIKKVLTKDQVEKLLNTAKNIDCDWYPHWAMAVYTGMRNGELYALKWQNVDLENRVILVNCSWNSKNGFKSTKSGDDRLVPIAPALLPVLQELKLKHGCLSEFVLPRLAKWDKGDQARELRFFLAGMGIEQCRFHDLRATFATLLLQSGIPTLKVMKAGGWKTLKTMMIYVRKAGVDIHGMMDDFTLHNPYQEQGKVFQLSTGSDKTES